MAKRVWGKRGRSPVLDWCSLSWTIASAVATVALCLAGSEIMAYSGHPWAAAMAVVAAGGSVATAIFAARARVSIDRAQAVLAAAAAGSLEARVVGASEGGTLGDLDRSVNRVLDLTEGFAAKATAAGGSNLRFLPPVDRAKVPL